MESWFYIPTAIAVGVFIVIGILHEYEKIPKKEFKKLSMILLYSWSFIVIEGYFFINTRKISDYLLLNLVAGICSIVILILDRKKAKVNRLFRFLLTIGLILSIALILDYYLIRPVPHIVWIASIAGSYTSSADKKYKENTLDGKNILAYGFGAIVLISLFGIFNVSFIGTSRASREVETFLIHEEGYDESDIGEILDIQLKKGLPESVEINFTDGTDKYYEYYNNEIQETNWENIRQRLIKQDNLE